MCGLVGIAGQIGIKEERVLRTMLILDSLRGEDSTGIAAIPRAGEIIVAKELGAPFNLFDSKRFNNAMKKANRAIIGHNRYATMGGVSRATAHPFEFDTLVGAHNGTLRNKHRLADHLGFTVDSENLFHHIEKHGLRDALDVVDGAYALVWWSKDDDTLNFLRNDERPMFVAGTKDAKTMLWASEAWMLSIAASKNGLEISEIVSMEIDTHYTFHIDHLGNLGKPHLSPAAAKKPEPYVYQGQGGYTTWNNGVKQHHGVTPPATVAPVGNVHQLPPPLSFEKKNTLSLKSSKTAGLQEYYKGLKSISLEIIGQSVDKSGSLFLNLMDAKHPEAEIRLYIHARSNLKDAVGRHIIADMGSYCSNRKEGDYFKVPPTNYALLDEEPAPKWFKSSYFNNVLLTKQEWEARYENCDWCFINLKAEDVGNRLTSDGKCLCPDCAGDPATHEHVNLAAVF